jgi:acyl-CoA thioester hydrolase
MRWADLDMLGHVNNVVYLDYAAEARGRLVASGDLFAGQVAQAQVEFRLPMLLTRDAITVSSHVADDGALVQQVGLEGSDKVYAEVVTRTEAQQVEPLVSGVDLALGMRASDISSNGELTSAKVLEYIQEVRIQVLDAIKTPRAGSFVVASTVIDALAPVTAPVDVAAPELLSRTAIARIGKSSCTLLTDLYDSTGRQLVGSRTVMVGFDAKAQRSRPFSDGERESFTTILLG